MVQYDLQITFPSLRFVHLLTAYMFTFIIHRIQSELSGHIKLFRNITCQKL